MRAFAIRVALFGDVDFDAGVIGIARHALPMCMCDRHAAFDRPLAAGQMQTGWHA